MAKSPSLPRYQSASAAAPMASLVDAGYVSVETVNRGFSADADYTGGLLDLALPATQEANPEPTPTPEPAATAESAEVVDPQKEPEDSAEWNPLSIAIDTQKIKAHLEPAIYIDGKPTTLSWTLPDWYEQEPGETRHMIIRLPESLDALSNLAEKEIIVPVTAPSGSTTFTLPSSVVHTLGDVVISVETALRESDAWKEPVEHAIDRLLIHGILHLLGYDHEGSIGERSRMEKEEERLMALLGEG